MNGCFGIGWRVHSFRLELGFWGRGEAKKPTLCVRIASAEKAFNLTIFCLRHSVAMVIQKNSSSSLPCQPYSLLFNAFRPCWTPAPQYEYVQALHRKHKALGFFNNSCIRANTHFHSLTFFFNVGLSRIYVSGGGNPFPKHSSFFSYFKSTQRFLQYSESDEIINQMLFS